MTDVEVAELIERFLSGSKTLGPFEWNDFISIKNTDPKVEMIRLEVLQIEAKNPAKIAGHWCSEGGFISLSRVAKRLRRASKY